jgi:hypothetical protein
MAQLTIDLGNPEDLRYARDLIASALRALEGEPEETPSDRHGESELSPEEAQAYARRLWERVRTPKTRELISWLAEADGPFSLEDLATAKRDVSYEDIKARKFRFGRTEKKLHDEFGIRLLEQQWVDWHYVYTMNPITRDAIRAIVREAA